MNTKTLLAITLAMVCFFSCKKSNNNDVTPIYSDKVVLEPIKVTGNIATLNWSVLNNDSLQSYFIYRTTDSTSAQQIAAYYKRVDKGTNKLIDTLPMAPYVQYYVVAQMSSTSTYPYYNNNVKQSNKQAYARTDIDFLSFTPMDVLYDKDNHQLYAYSSAGDIAIYNMQSKKFIKKITTNATIGYCDLGIYNGKTELYVPRNDGWLFIYDATTLTQIDQINIGTSITSTVYNSGVLFISTSSYNNNFATYSRATKALITQTGYYSSNNVRMKKIPNTNTEFLGIDGSSQVYDYIFDNNGKYLSQKSNSIYPNMGYNSSSLLEIFPDGSNFITSNTGIIIGRDLKYVSTLPHGNISYMSFCFDISARLIYAGCSIKTIQAYSMDNYQLVKTINTQGYPTKIFYDNGAIISVSSTSSSSSYYYPTGYAFIEQF